MSILIIACGAIARELTQLIRLNGWEHVTLACLPPELHNVPHRIPEEVRTQIELNRQRYDSIYVAYADCGTGGRLDGLLASYGIHRLPGAHCYDFLAGPAAFESFSTLEPGTFYVTDFLVRNFDRLVYRGLGLDRHPQLRSSYFKNYRKLLYLAQTDNERLKHLAREGARLLDLAYEHHFTGLGPLEKSLEPYIQLIPR